MSKFLLETDNLKKSFQHINGSITLFENLNLKVKEGDLVALVGPSGSGKSSLLHLLALLDEPTKGKIIIDMHDTGNLTADQKDELRKKRPDNFTDMNVDETQIGSPNNNESEIILTELEKCLENCHVIFMSWFINGKWC